MLESHLTPLKPVGQIQVKPLILSTHVPLKKKKKTDRETNINKEKEIKMDN